MEQSCNDYWLPAHVRACSSGSGAVLLDLKRNRYFGIGQREASVLATLAANRREHWLEQSPIDDGLSAAEIEHVASKLIEAGFLSTGSAPQAAFASAAIDLEGRLVSIGREIDRSTTLRSGHAIDFIRSCAWTRRVLRSWNLYSIAVEISEAKTRGAARFEPQAAAELVHVFRRLRPYAFAAKDQCLLHALTLVRFLSRYRIFPTWVIGVRGRPWAAHSWVQQGSLLLDATPEQVCEYTPILAI